MHTQTLWFANGSLLLAHPAEKGVLGGWSPHLLEDNHLNVATLLKTQGYATGCIGKWHLGMDWPAAGGNFGDAIEPARKWQEIDFTKSVTHGPTAAGFENFFGISAFLDMPPSLFCRMTCSSVNLLSR